MIVNVARAFRFEAKESYGIIGYLLTETDNYGENISLIFVENSYRLFIRRILKISSYVLQIEIDDLEEEDQGKIFVSVNKYVAV